MGISPINHGHYRMDTLNPTLYNHRCMDSSSCHCPLPNQHGKKVCGSKRQLDTKRLLHLPRRTTTHARDPAYLYKLRAPATRTIDTLSKPRITGGSRGTDNRGTKPVRRRDLRAINTTTNPRRTLPTSTLPEYLPGNSDGSLNNRTKY